MSVLNIRNDLAGGAAFETVLNLRVPDPSGFFEGSEGLIYLLS